MPQTLSQIKTLLRSQGLRPKKRYGQNFLHDGNQMDKIIAAADVQPGDVVLEVGAGTGALSLRLLDAGARLIALEIDRDLEPILRPLLEPYGDRVSLVIGDVLEGKHKLSTLVTRLLYEHLGAVSAHHFKCVSNLPYDVASPLILNLLTCHVTMQQAVVMVQREVADRLAAAPATKAYGPLGIMTQALAEVEVIGRVPPTSFWPAPAVESAIVRLTPREKPVCDDPAAFARTLHCLFSKRRKQIKSIIGKDRRLPAGVQPENRPEQLTVQQLAALTPLIS